MNYDHWKRSLSQKRQSESRPKRVRDEAASPSGGCLVAEPLNSADLAVANLKRKVGVLTPLDVEILDLTPDDGIEA